MSTQSTLTYSLFLRPSTQQDTFKKELFIQSNNSSQSVPQQRYSGTLKTIRKKKKGGPWSWIRWQGKGKFHTQKSRFENGVVSGMWPFTEVVCHQVTKVVFHQGGLSPRWSLHRGFTVSGAQDYWQSALSTVFVVVFRVFCQILHPKRYTWMKWPKL